MPICVNYLNGRFRLYSSVVDNYVTDPLTEAEVLREPDVTPERVARARTNGCSYIRPDRRCTPGKELVRGDDGLLVLEDAAEWESPVAPLARWTITLYLEVPGNGVGYDHARGIDDLVWQMRKALQRQTGVWWKYERKQRDLLDAEGRPVEPRGSK